MHPFHAGRLVALVLAIGSVSPAHAQVTPASSEPARTMESARLRSGDIVRITVWRQPELSGEFAITADGRIAHPLYREINVVGRPVAEIEAEVERFLRRYVENPQFVLLPLIRVSVTGYVDRPNVYAVTVGTTVTQAVAQAGGVTEQGRQDRVRLVRDQRERFLDLTNPTDGNLQVESGDEIFVSQRSQWFRNVVVPVATIVGAVTSIVIAIRRY